MLILNERKFISAAFDSEAELERVVVANAEYIFGPGSVYFPKTLIRTHDGFGTVPDGFVVDLANREWFIVEAELSKHSVWTHIAPQVAKQLIATTTPTTKQLLINLVVQQIQCDADLKERFLEEGIPEINIRQVLAEIFEKKPTIGMPIDGVTTDLREWAATLKVNVKLWIVRKHVEFGKPDVVLYEIPEEYRPVLDTDAASSGETESRSMIRYNVAISDLLEAGLLSPGQRLTMSYRPRNGERRDYDCHIHANGDVEMLGERFSAPTYAALYAMENAGTTRTTVNGWTVLKTETGDTLSDIRERYLAQRRVE